MLEITKYFLQTKVIEISSKSDKFSTTQPRKAINFNSYKALYDANLRFLLSYQLEYITKEHFGQRPTMIVALTPESLPLAVLLCQKNSLYSDLPISCFPPQKGTQSTPFLLADFQVKNAKMLLIIDICDSECQVCSQIDSLQKNGNEILGVISMFSTDPKKTLNFFKNKKIDFISLSQLKELDTSHQK